MAEPHKSRRTVLEKLQENIPKAFTALDAGPGNIYESSGPGWSVAIRRHRRNRVVFVECQHALARVEFFETLAEKWGYKLQQFDQNNDSWFVTRK